MSNLEQNLTDILRKSFNQTRITDRRPLEEYISIHGPALEMLARHSELNEPKLYSWEVLQSIYPEVSGLELDSELDDRYQRFVEENNVDKKMATKTFNSILRAGLRTLRDLLDYSQEYQDRLSLGRNIQNADKVRVLGEHFNPRDPKYRPIRNFGPENGKILYAFMDSLGIKLFPDGYRPQELDYKKA